MYCANPDTCEHDDSEFRNHGEVHCDPVAFLDTEVLQDIRSLVDLTEELTVGVGL